MNLVQPCRYIRLEYAFARGNYDTPWRADMSKFLGIGKREGTLWPLMEEAVGTKGYKELDSVLDFKLRKFPQTQNSTHEWN